MVHKTTRFRDDEVDGVLDAWDACDEIECVRVQGSSPWRGVRLVVAKPGHGTSQPANWPVQRGALQFLSRRDGLLYVNGTAPGLASGSNNFYQGAKSIPRPLLITRDAGAGPLERTGNDVLALTKMDWNNDALYDPLPVTIKYSQTLARIIGHTNGLPTPTPTACHLGRSVLLHLPRRRVCYRMGVHPTSSRLEAFTDRWAAARCGNRACPRGTAPEGWYKCVLG